MRRVGRCPSDIATPRNATASRSSRPSPRSSTRSRAAATRRRPPRRSDDPMPEDSSDFAGDPDGFGRLWTPHRLVYIKGENKPQHDEAGADCPFCLAPTRSDEDGLIVARGELVYAVLNLYPYNSGHLMTVPYRHVADYTDLTGPETSELGRFTQFAMSALRDVMGPHGFNIGINQGAVGGAGIAG